MNVIITRLITKQKYNINFIIMFLINTVSKLTNHSVGYS